jgi:FkbM family methyltransferase
MGRLRDVVFASGLDRPIKKALKYAGPRRWRHEIRDDENLDLLVKFTLAEDANCIDIGCHRGRVLGQIVAAAPKGRHIAFEPIPEFAARLRGAFPSVDVREMAASNEAGKVEFTYYPGKPALSGLRRRTHVADAGARTIEVEMESIDSAIPAGYEPALIKIDVEGAERQVIEGALETIKRFRPTVVFEHESSGAAYYDTDPGDIFRLLVDEAGLRIFDLRGTGPYSREEFSQAYASGSAANFVAHR